MDFDQYADEYNQMLIKSTAGIIKDVSTIAESKVASLKRFIDSKPTAILDYGCGIGNNLNALKNAFETAEVYGYDPSEKSLYVAAASCPDCRFINQQELPRFKTCFDLILVSCVVHHIPGCDRYTFAKEAHSLLKPGGWIVIIEHNVYNPITRAAVSWCPYDKDAELIRASKVRRLLTTAGFTDGKSEYIMFTPPSWKRFQLLDKLLKNVPLGGQHITKAKRPEK